MKKNIISLFLLMISATVVFAQAPQKFSYQAVVRDAAGNLVSNAPVGVRVSILKSTADGVAVYCETHLNNTNATGLLLLEIGGGTVVGGDFTSIDWANGPYFLKTETDVTGGTHYTMTSSQQLLSVPYALYAGNAIDMEERMNNVEKRLDSLKPNEGSLAYLEERMNDLEKRLDSMKPNEGFGMELLPLVSTNEVTNIWKNTASCGGNVGWEGGAPVTARGVCWSTSQNPTTADSHTTDGSGTGTYISLIEELTYNTTYYVRAYATNSIGTRYGSQQQFTTLDTESDGKPCPGAATVTDYDGNTYNTVQIGEQCWMQENLRTTRYSDGTSIALGSSTSTSTAYRYCPNNSSSNVSTYGYLYNWLAVMHNATSSESNPSGVQGICPTGWHVPSNEEWAQLENYVGSQSAYQCNGSSSNIAKALASAMGWSSSTTICAIGNNPSLNNATGFSAVPAGYYYGYYNFFGDYAYFWSATQSYSSHAFYRGLKYYNADVLGSNDNKYNAYSVRCLRD